MKKYMNGILALILMFSDAGCTGSPASSADQKDTPATAEPAPEKEELDPSQSYEYLYDTVIAETEYYKAVLTRILLFNQEGVWMMMPDIEVTNTSDARYLIGEAWKAEAGWDPGKDWVDPGEKILMGNMISCPDAEDLSGNTMLNVWGWNWDGSTGTQLFKDTYQVTLRFDEKEPVVSVSKQ